MGLESLSWNLENRHPACAGSGQKNAKTKYSIQPADEVCMGFRIFPVEIGAACQVMLISD
jgi:hypothetical protein